MKRIPIILLFLVLAPAASAQRSIDEVLRQVENASRELEAQRQLTAAQKQDAATGKYMANPTVEMEKMWGAAGAGQNTELAVVQTIDFPTVYGSRNRIAKLKGSLYEKQWESQRQQLLLQAKQLCIEIVYLYRQRDLLDERLSNAERLSEAYRRKMETGDATSLEANKIAVESISARTAADLNRAELQAKIQQLNTMTGDSDDSFEDVTYPPVETLPPADVLSEAYMSGNPLLESMENTLEIDRRTVALNRGLLSAPVRDRVSARLWRRPRHGIQGRHVGAAFREQEQGQGGQGGGRLVSGSIGKRPDERGVPVPDAVRSGRRALRIDAVDAVGPRIAEQPRNSR